MSLLGSSTNDSLLSVFENQLSFNSMRVALSESEREAIDIEDDVLATLLNPNGAIQIDNYLFFIDVENDHALVYDLESESEDPLEFTTGVSFFDYLDGVENRYSTFCDAKNKLNDVIVGDLEIDSKVVYQHALIYFSLQSKIKKNRNEGYYNLKLSSSNDSYYYKKGSTTCYDISNHTEGPGYDRSYHYRAYSGVKRCTGFRFIVTFSVYRNLFDYEEWTLRIDCGAN
ncbi:MAG: hypothetical protein J6P73_01510 [Bacteroidales bacterium]|nr:hypothetical protein [Bacteroidales bacterium]